MPRALLAALEQQDLSISYLGPLSRAQKQQEISGILRWLEGVAAIAQIDPNSLDLIDMDKVQESLHNHSEQSELFLRSQETVKQLRDARQKQAQEQQQLADAQQGAGIASDIATAGTAARTEAAA